MINFNIILPFTSSLQSSLFLSRSRKNETKGKKSEEREERNADTEVRFLSLFI
jgi:hypothetical protein